MRRTRLVAGNWKMHGSRASNQALLDALLAEIGVAAGAECAVCPPFPFLQQVAERLRGSPIAWGAQNVSEHAQGAYTGEVSAAMLRSVGCRYVILGHSERRAHFRESDSFINKKVLAAVQHGDGEQVQHGQVHGGPYVALAVGRVVDVDEVEALALETADERATEPASGSPVDGDGGRPGGR